MRARIIRRQPFRRGLSLTLKREADGTIVLYSKPRRGPRKLIQRWPDWTVENLEPTRTFKAVRSSITRALRATAKAVAVGGQSWS